MRLFKNRKEIQIKVKKLEQITIVVLIVNVLIGFPLIILNVLKRSKYLPLFIGLFAFCMGYFFVPSNDSYDIYRHYDNFEKLSQKIIPLYYSKDYYLKYLMILLKKIEFRSNFLGAISCFILYYLLIKSYIIILKKRVLDSKNMIFWFGTVLLSVSFIYYTGLRYSTAVSFFVYGIINLVYENKKIKGIVFLILSIMSHFGIAPLIPIVLMYLFIIKKISIRKLKIIVIVCFIIGNIISEKIILDLINFINSYGIIYFNPYTYISGEWGINYKNNANFIGKLISNIQVYLKILTMLYYSVINIKVNSIKMKKLNILLISYAFILQNFFTPFERSEKIIFIFIIFSLIRKINLRKILKKENIIILLVLINIYMIQLLDLKQNIQSYMISYGKIINISLFKIILDICL